MFLREKLELVAIGLAVLGTWIAGPHLPTRLAAGSASLLVASLLLGQGLVRDLYLKFGAPGRAPAAACAVGSGGKSSAFCMESALGILGIATGGLLLGFGAGGTIVLSRLGWALGIGAMGCAGFVLKDVVIDLRTGRLHREKDHRNVIVW